MTSHKQGTEIRDMVDVFAPPISLLAKLGSIIVHVEEGSGLGGHHFDWITVGNLIADREVQNWLTSMRNKALLPVKRNEAVERVPQAHARNPKAKRNRK